MQETVVYLKKITQPEGEKKKSWNGNSRSADGSCSGWECRNSMGWMEKR